MKAVRLIALSLLFISPFGFTQLTIEITQGADNPTSIAIVPFDWQGSGALAEDIPAVVADDLQRVGQFEPVARENMLGFPHRSEDVFYRDWRAIGADYVVVGRIAPPAADGLYRVEYELLDVVRQKKVLSRVLRGSGRQLRDLAHKVSDEVYEQITGIKGAFSTRILYVVANSLGKGKFNYQLKMADFDGERETTILDSQEPILSPTWAPDGREIAYVSFETGRPAIYRHQWATGQRERLTRFSGLNSAPAWSPDGSQLAFVLSKDGSPDIYVMDLGTRKIRKLAGHYAIDTEPSWMPDGQSIIFTSDRGGKPQIYRVNVASGAVERLTFDGDYNARARYLPERNALVMVHRSVGSRSFHIAVQNLDTGAINILSRSPLDESPTVAPNGAMLLYATQYQSKGILAGVSIDGSVRFRLPSGAGNVREPAWSPYLN